MLRNKNLVIVYPDHVLHTNTVLNRLYAHIATSKTIILAINDNKNEGIYSSMIHIRKTRIRQPNFVELHLIKK